MKHLKHINEYHGFYKNIIDNRIIEIFKNHLTWNSGIEKIVNICSSLGKDISSMRGTDMSRLRTNKDENLISKIIINHYFRTKPKLVGEKLWNFYNSKLETYWRGVPSIEYVESFKYGKGDFTGNSNIIQGTWVTTDKDYALDYSDKNIPETLIEVLINNCKLADAYKLHEKEISLHKIFNDIKENLLGDKNMDKHLYHTLSYIINEIVHNKTVLSIILGYEGYQTNEKSGDVLVIFNQEKIIIKK